MADFVAVIRRGVDSGEFQRVDPATTARLLVAPFLMTVIWRHTFARHDSALFDPEALINQHREILLHGLAANDQGTPSRSQRRRRSS